MSFNTILNKTNLFFINGVIIGLALGYLFFNSPPGGYFTQVWIQVSNESVTFPPLGCGNRSSRGERAPRPDKSIYKGTRNQ